MDLQKRSGLIWLVVVSAALGALAVWQFTGRSRSPRLTNNALSAARLRWAQSAIKDYSMKVVVLGAEKHVHEVEVQSGKVVRLRTDGIEAPERVWNYWSVDGMFVVLEEELANAHSPQRVFGVNDPEDVFEDASFDAVTGVPTRYLRQVASIGNSAMEWEIRDFNKL